MVIAVRGGKGTIRGVMAAVEGEERRGMAQARMS